MPLAIVQVDSMVLDNLGSTPTYSPPSNVTAGNSGIIGVIAVESTSMDMNVPTDSQGNVWALCTDGTHNAKVKNASGITCAAIFKCDSFLSTGPLTITNHFVPGGGGGIGGFLTFAEGTSINSPSVDQVVNGGTNGANSTTQAFANPTTVLNELLFGFAFSDSSTLNTGHATPLGWSLVGANQNGEIGANGVGIYKIVSGLGTYSTTMSCTGGGNGGYYMAMVSFKEAVAVPACNYLGTMGEF